MHRRPLIPWRINNAVKNELDACGANLGYHRIWAGLKNQKILVGKQDVRKTILELKAEVVQQRKRRKLVRRIDDHDKLKNFSFSVHERIDGFSRKLLWLEVTSSNKVLEIISQYYLKALKKLKRGSKKHESR